MEEVPLQAHLHLRAKPPKASCMAAAGAGGEEEEEDGKGCESGVLGR